VVDFVDAWSEKTELCQAYFISQLGIARGKFFDWKKRYGKVNEHNGKVPRDHWLTDVEKEEILDFHRKNPLEGYRSLAFMLLDEGKVCVSPSSVWRVLKNAGVIDRKSFKPSKKGTGFVQPLLPHEHWHVDVAYLNLSSTFYYLCSILDGYSRAIVHYDIRESMTEADIERIIERAKEKYPEAKPRIISDNGPQFIAKDFKEFIRISGMSHVRTSPYYPQSNGKIERYHRSLKSEALRPASVQTLDAAKLLVGRYVDHYNTVRLHSALGYIAPMDYLMGKQKAIWEARDEKLNQARAKRAQWRRQMSSPSSQVAA